MQKKVIVSIVILVILVVASAIYSINNKYIQQRDSYTSVKTSYDELIASSSHMKDSIASLTRVISEYKSSSHTENENTNIDEEYYENGKLKTRKYNRTRYIHDTLIVTKKDTIKTTVTVTVKDTQYIDKVVIQKDTVKEEHELITYPEQKRVNYAVFGGARAGYGDSIGRYQPVIGGSVDVALMGPIILKAEAVKSAEINLNQSDAIMIAVGVKF